MVTVGSDTQNPLQSSGKQGAPEVLPKEGDGGTLLCPGWGTYPYLGLKVLP